MTQAMKSVLGPRSSHLSLPESPQLITTPTLWHLATPIEGTALAEEKRHVAGLPTAPDPGAERLPAPVAKRLIAELEPFDRQLFGGIVGWCDDEGNGEWVVTIRCARLHQRSLRLFAGAGIVPASSPLGEWRENRRQTHHHAQRIWLELRGKDDCIYPLAGRVCGPLSSKRLLAGSAVNQSDYSSCGQ